jgi:hypothetical protein
MQQSTTYGVHLYKDESLSPSVPPGLDSYHCSTFLADAEGFGADEGATNAEIRGPFAPDERDIQEFPLLPQDYIGKGKAGIDNFYWRLLHTLTDVMVFVTEKDQAVHQELVHLLEWAASTRLKSVNYPPKTLIIVRNRAKMHHSQLYNDWELYKQYLSDNSRSNLWEGTNPSRILADFVVSYNNRKRDSRWEEINNNEQLFRALFFNIKCCYIPNVDRVMGQESEMFHQYEQLRSFIEVAVADSIRMRHGLGMLLNVPQQVHLQGHVFNHLTTETTPFNYSAAAKGGNVDPTSVPSHMANFLRHALRSPYASTSEGENGGFICDMFVLAALLEENRHLPGLF